MEWSAGVQTRDLLCGRPKHIQLIFNTYFLSYCKTTYVAATIDVN